MKALHSEAYVEARLRAGAANSAGDHAKALAAYKEAALVAPTRFHAEGCARLAKAKAYDLYGSMGGPAREAVLAALREVEHLL